MLALARLREEEAKLRSQGADGATLLALQREIEAREKIVGLINSRDARKAAEDSAKDAARDWERAAADIERSLTDSLLRGFESGKGFAENLRDTLKNMFNTLVLRPIISAVVNPVAGALTGALGLSGAANAGSSALSTAGSIGSGYSALAGIGGAFGGGLSGGFGGLMGSLGLSATGSTLGGALSAGGIALQSGNILGGLGTLVGALGPIAAGIGVLASIFGKDDSGTYHTGGAGSYSAAGGANTGAKVLDQGLTFGVRYKDYNSQAESAAVGISQSIVGMLDATAKSFGNQAGYFAATAFADDSSKDGAWGSLIIKRLDDTVTNWADTQTSKWAPKVFSDGEAGQKEYSAALALSVRDALVGAVEGVDWAQGLLKGLGSAPTLEGLQGVVETINAAKAAFVGFGQYMPAFTELTNSAVSKMADASGGVGALAGNMGAFVDGSSGIKGLYGEVESARTASAAEGMAFIENALRNARATGYLPESAALNDAITSARGGMGDRQYTSQADQDFDRLVLAGQLKELTGYAEPQLTAAEQAAQSAEDQIKALDDILRNARDQVDELRGIDTSVKSIPEALAALQVALVAESQAQTQSFLAGIVAGLSSGQIKPQDAIQRYEGKDGEVIPREKWVDLAGTQSYISSGGAVALGGNAQSGLDAVVTGKTGTQFTVRSAVDYVNEAMRTGDLRAVYNAAVMHGISSTSLDAMMGWPGGTALDWAKSQGLPAFAVGTNYVPRDMVARIHEGEAIVPKAYNPAANPGMGGNSARMESLLSEINAKLEELKGLQSEGNDNTGGTRDLIDRVSGGGNAFAAEIMNQPTVEIAA